MKKRLFGKIICLGLVMTVVALALPTGVTALENEDLNETCDHDGLHGLYKEGYKMIEHIVQKTRDKNIVGTHGSHDNYNNINIEIKNVVNTGSHLHHPEEQHPLHAHSHTHETDHEHPTHAHSYHTNIFNRVVTRFLEILQSIRHILGLINSFGGYI